MSERVRNTVITSLAGSKRIIVAACAGIAMFLGAMSAGASVFVHSSESSRASSLSAVAGATSASKGAPWKALSADKSTDGLKHQSMFKENDIMPLRQSSLYSTPAPQPTNQIKNAIKKNPVADALKNATSAAIFQNQANLLDNLQSKPTQRTDNAIPTEVPNNTDTIHQPAVPADEPADNSQNDEVDPVTNETPPPSDVIETAPNASIILTDPAL